MKLRKKIALTVGAILFLSTNLCCSPAEAIRTGLNKKCHNFFGYGTDGAKTVSSDETIDYSSGTGECILQYTTLTINSTRTLTIIANRGVYIYVQGACTINGTLRIRTGGSAVPPSDGIFVKYFTNSSGARGAPATDVTPAVGGAGAAGVINTDGATGGTLANAPGGGGSGGDGNATNPSGAGGAASCWGGGSGGAVGGSATGDPGEDNCGAAGTTPSGTGTCSGAAGNPSGTGTIDGNNPSFNSFTAAEEGTGGYLYLNIGGNFTTGASGKVNLDGFRAGRAISTDGNAKCGGASGGGKGRINYTATLSHLGTFTAAGGVKRDHEGVGGQNRDGGAGGAGVANGPTLIAD